MKRRIIKLSIILLFPVFLISCGKGTKEFRLAEFKSVVSFICNDTEFTGNLEYISAGNISLTLNSPEHIKGIKFVFDGNKTDIICDDLLVPIENLKVGTDVYTPLFNTLSYLSAADIKIKNDGIETVVLDENLEVSVNISCGDMRVVSLKNSGIIYNFNYK